MRRTKARADDAPTRPLPAKDRAAPLPARSASKAQKPALLWFRQDLRLADNAALAAAIASGRPLVCAFVLDDEGPGRRRLGGASRWWLHQSLKALAASIAERGGRLILRRGDAGPTVNALVRETGAEAVYWNRRYEPAAIAEDTALKAQLKAAGVDVQSSNGALLKEPWDVKNATGGPFKVFSPFWRTVSAALESPAPNPAPKALPAGPDVASERLEDWGLEPKRPDWAGGLRAAWRGGEERARVQLEAFAAGALGAYAAGRNTPGEPSTSRLSPRLHFGELSPWAVWRAAEMAAGATRKNIEKFQAELGWREFAHHLLHQSPDLAEANWRSSFDAFPWRDDEAGFAAWSKGRTGYPIVDAGMRELWETGWMHNRVRMITASFLIKHLMIDWRAGEAWFWDTLVDADLAVNAASWQWVAGSGADAAPYFRIFNPVTQGEKFDADGRYVRRWVPELARLPDQLIHKPWTASPLVLQEAGVRLGTDYPLPMVDHAAARARALAAFEGLKKSA